MRFQLSFEQCFIRAAPQQGPLVPPELPCSRNIDTGSIEISQGTDNDLPQNPYNLKADPGLSNYDVRNYFVTFWNWDLPSLPGPKLLVSGWHWNAITTLASGNPFSAVISFDRARAIPQSGTAPETPNLWCRE
jgi:hypothetical protein